MNALAGEDLIDHAALESQIVARDRLFFFNDTATTEIYTLSLHDALPICPGGAVGRGRIECGSAQSAESYSPSHPARARPDRSEEHTSELQSRGHLVCRLLLEKKKKTQHPPHPQNKTNNKENTI